MTAITAGTLLLETTVQEAASDRCFPGAIRVGLFSRQPPPGRSCGIRPRRQIQMYVDLLVQCAINPKAADVLLAGGAIGLDNTAAPHRET